MQQLDAHTVTRQQEIENPKATKPHVVILGAGASVAAFPEGDRNGTQLPTMEELGSLPEIAAALEKHDVKSDNDFEELYSRLANDPLKSELCNELESAIRKYFSGLEICEKPTLYDHLVMALRPRDLIATFNWDPLLVQAIERVHAAGFTEIPHVAFLHGNVGVGVCETHGTLGTVDALCKDCGSSLSSVPLLYPVESKNYESHSYIKSAWESLTRDLGHALFFTVFGYRAPKSDVAAIEAFRKAWGSWQERQFEEVELIVRPGSDHQQVRDRWKDFIHTHHFEIHEDFFESWIANHPRRTVEAWYNQYILAKFIDNNPVPRDLGFEDTVDWYSKLNDHEAGELPPFRRED